MFVASKRLRIAYLSTIDQVALSPRASLPSVLQHFVASYIVTIFIVLICLDNFLTVYFMGTLSIV